MDPIKATNSNKSIGAGAGVLGGGSIGVLAITILDLHYKVSFSPELTALLAATITGATAVVGAFFAPIFTAAQQAAIRHLNETDRAQAEAVVEAVQTSSVKR